MVMRLRAADDKVQDLNEELLQLRVKANDQDQVAELEQRAEEAVEEKKRMEREK